MGTKEESSNQKTELFDIAIIGYGPVGAVAAILLGQNDLRVLVIEKEQDVYSLPRAIALDNEVMRILQRLGITEELLQDFVSSTRYEFVDRHRRMLFAIQRELRDSVDFWGQTFLFRQPELERVLRRRVGDFPNVEVHTGEEFLGLTQEDERVDIKTDAGCYAAKYVLGCDGARSSVRETCQIPLKELATYSEPWLIVDAKLKEDAQVVENMQQLCHPYRAVSYIPRYGTKDRRWEFQLRQGESAESIRQTETIYQLISPWISREKVAIERTAIYTFRALEAAAWRRGRVFLLGDAAHMMPPFLGQGLSSGTRDAANLCWKISSVLQGTVHASILETYELERKEHVRVITYLAIAFGRIIMGKHFVQIRDGLFALANSLPMLKKRMRNLSFDLPRMPDRISTKKMGNPYSGRRILQSAVRYKGDVVLLDDIIGTGFAIVGLGENPKKWLETCVLKKWEQFGTAFVEVLLPDEKTEKSDVDIAGAGRREEDGVVVVTDIHGELDSFFKMLDAKCLIVRPDKYILGKVGPTGDFVKTLTRQLEQGATYPSTDSIARPNIFSAVRQFMR